MPAGLGRRSSVGLAGWVRVVGTWRSDAAGRRQLRFSSRSLRARPHGPPDVLPLCLANADPSSAKPRFRRDRLLTVRFLSVSARNLWTKGSLRRTRNSPGSLALSPHLFDWKNLALSVGRCRRHHLVAHLGRCHALPAAPRLHLRAGIVGLLLAVLCHSRLRDGQHHLHLLGLLQHLPSRRRNPPRRSTPSTPIGATTTFAISAAKSAILPAIFRAAFLFPLSASPFCIWPCRPASLACFHGSRRKTRPSSSAPSWKSFTARPPRASPLAWSYGLLSLPCSLSCSDTSAAPTPLRSMGSS